MRVEEDVRFDLHALSQLILRGFYTVRRTRSSFEEEGAIYMRPSFASSCCLSSLSYVISGGTLGGEVAVEECTIYLDGREDKRDKSKLQEGRKKNREMAQQWVQRGVWSVRYVSIAAISCTYTLLTC